MNDHREQRESLGAYVLGALEPDERHALEAHLEHCASCRDELSRLSALPPLLDHLSAEEAADGSLLPPSGTHARAATTILSEARAMRRQVLRWRSATGVAAAAAVATLLMWSPWSGRSADRWELRATSASPGVEASAAALAWEWGTTVELDLDVLPPADRYVVWTVARDGRREQAGTWGRTASGHAYVRGASAIQRADLARIEVGEADGTVLATFDVAPPA